MEIAYTPADARRIIQQNKLALVLGADLAPLFRSAEDYVRMWEKCERRRPTVAPSAPPG